MWLVYAISASMVWGLSYVIAERIFQHKASPLTIVGIEMFVGSLILLCVSWFNKLTTDLKDIAADSSLWFLLICGTITSVGGNLLIAASIKEKNAVLAGLVEISYPLFVALFAYLLFGVNHINTSVVIGGLLIMLGVVLIYIGNT